MLKKIRKLTLIFLLLTALLSLHIVNAADTSRTIADPVYANFRNVRSGIIGWNNLYRSQHPANGSSRSYHANRLAEAAGINTVLNLSDSDHSLEKYFASAGLDSSYYYRTLYARGSVYTANMGLHFNRSSFPRKVASALRFAARHKGPYLVHCQIGRDRTGFVILVMESLMGVSYNYILEDYTKSNMNLQGWSYEKSRSRAVRTLNDNFHYITGKKRSTDWSKENLILLAKRYLKRKGGMTEGELAALQRNLSVSYPRPEYEAGYGFPALAADPESPAARNLSIGGQTALSRTIRAGEEAAFFYRLRKGSLSSYEVECDNSDPSKAVVSYCGNGMLKVRGLQEGKAVLCLHSRGDLTKRVRLVISVIGSDPYAAE